MHEPRTIFVAGFLPSTNKKQIEDLFSECGEIKSVTMKNFPGKPPYCFVAFSTQEEADLAVEKFNNFILNSRTINVRPSNSKSNSKSNSTPKKRVYPFLRLMIKPCPSSLSNEKELRLFAQPYEIVHPIYFFEDEDGIEIVIFNLKNLIDDKDFILLKNEKVYQGQKIFIQQSIYKIPTRLNFRGFPRTTIFEEALDFFSEFGNIFQLTLFDDRNGYIVFISPIESQKFWNQFESQMQHMEIQ
jgi:RNA recognition motif-containing protein